MPTRAPTVKKPAPRRQVAVSGTWNTIQLDLRNPYTITFWSIAYGGLGHILLDRYFRGFILISAEIVFNSLSHLNLAIFYTLTKHFDLARQILDSRWLMLYMGVYCFAILDSYRETMVINNTYRLADRENAEIKNFVINSNSFNILNSISPWTVMLCSAVMPGTGCFLIQRMNRALYLMLVWTFISYLSGVYPALIYTMAGQFDLAKSVLNMQWVLNIPSIWFFGVYEAYNCALENNKLYRRAQHQFLRREYQSNRFLMPDCKKELQHGMYLFSIFEQSDKIEEAITSLQTKGLTKDAILAVPTESRNESKALFDTVHYSDNTGVLSLPFVIATIGALMGIIFGFQLYWGPILWGVIGAISGMIVGLVISLIRTFYRKRYQKAVQKGNIIIVVRCNNDQRDWVQDILWNNAAMSISQFGN